jgi:hypothetical protein
MIWLSLITVCLSLMQLCRQARVRQAQCRVSAVRPATGREHRFFSMPAEKLSNFARLDSREPALSLSKGRLFPDRPGYVQGVRR